ncbi:MAG: hypothetical protein N3A54_05670, partial [Patescibacteria group bacterium]|nr:hypothetical protein [Patescibacteria group bacterium]
MIEQRVGLVHFTFNNVENGGALAGVERVMETQKRILEARGVQVQMIVGATDAQNLYERGILLVPEVRSNSEWGWRNGDVEIDETRVCLVARKLYGVLSDYEVLSGGVVFHNTTNASKHNVPFGIA